MDSIIINIDKYLSNTQEFINDFKYELIEKELKQSFFSSVNSINMHYRDNINYCIDKYEIHCRALRDKLQNG